VELQPFNRQDWIEIYRKLLQKLTIQLNLTALKQRMIFGFIIQKGAALP
jgi:hypothetical protein